MFKAPTGMNDILPEEALLWLDIETKARKIFDCFGYRPIRTPILEEAKLFNRSLGTETEIVRKQMFTVARQDEDYALRPEGTAAVVRSYLEHALDKKCGLCKFYYIGPMFRAERPQKGRLRQFHHIGIEVLGSNSAYIDSEVIALADALLKEFGASGYKIKINSLGCPKDKKKFSELLHKALESQKKHLCQDCKERIERNIFRVLDCKNEECRKIISSLNIAYPDYLCAECLAHFQIVKENLQKLSIQFVTQITLVRGLDYYTRTVFEITHDSLGAQDALGAGGRYDHLAAQLGGEETGACGFALGVERVLLVNNSELSVHSLKPSVFVICLGEEARKNGFALLAELRKEGIASEMDFEDKSIKSQMRRANDSGARLAIIIGEDELKKQAATLKDMSGGNQEEVSLNNIVEQIKLKLK